MVIKLRRQNLVTVYLTLQLVAFAGLGQVLPLADSQDELLAVFSLLGIGWALVTKRLSQKEEALLLKSGLALGLVEAIELVSGLTSGLIKGMPVAPLIFILRILEKLHLSPLYPWVYETASTDSFVSIEKAAKLLGYKPQYSNKQALVRNYEWYVAHVNDFKGKSGVSHRVPWKQGLLACAKWFF